MKNNMIKKNKIYVYAFLPLAFLLIYALIGICYQEKENFLVIFSWSVVCVPIIFSSLYAVVLQINWKIQVIDNRVIVRNFFRISREYSINDLVVFYKDPTKKGAVKFYLSYKDKKIATITQFDEGLQLLKKFNCKGIGK